MELVTIPEKLEEFDIKLLDKMMDIPSIESETFDFKEEASDLHEDMCAMANAKGGFLVLGIGQVKGKDDKTLIGFKKTGFKKGDEDSIGNKINNFRFIVEPIPHVTLNHVYEEDGNRFYTIIKIESKISEKPYFIKNTDQCYVRLHSSSQRVGRTAILNLYSANVELQKNIENLRISSTILKESLLHSSSDISTLSWESTMKVTPIDLQLIKNSIISCESFLQENNLLGEHLSQTSFTAGFNSILHALEKLNTYLEAYNRENTSEGRRQLLGQFFSWGIGSGTVGGVVEFLDKIIHLTNEFLSKYK